ncbi:MAG: peptidoglycan DD-metalloendopeptidase family protein [Campylobacter sp.]|nr:peptidoglycan DD-metalloendopeptidase family protein [Campylobacter sp.]
MKTYLNFTDASGSKKYEFSPNFRRNLKLTVLLLALIFLFFIILSVTLKIKNEDLLKLSKELYTQNLELKKRVKSLEKSRSNLAKEFDQSGEELSNLELILALQDISLENYEESESLNIYDKGKFTSLVPNGWPVQNLGITGDYGDRVHPISGLERFHDGIDLRASIGTPAYATADGFVKFAGDSGTGYGNLVIIVHNFGFETRFAHMQSVVKRVGEWVKKGTLIGYTGNTGYSTGPHLHYEVRFLDHSLDPVNFIHFDNIFYKERKVPWSAVATAVEEL